MSRQPIFKPFCPDGAPFYACDYGTRFLGCCADTVGNEVCARGCSIVQAAGFDGDYYDQVTRNGCQSSEGQWYTCQDTSPAFLGCCKNNPCSQGRCSNHDLVAARLSTNQTEKAAFTTILAEKPSGSDRHIGAIAGGVVGGATFIIITACALLWYYKRKHRKQGLLPTSNANGSEGPHRPIQSSPPTPMYAANHTKSAPNELHMEPTLASELASSEVSQPVPGISVHSPTPPPQRIQEGGLTSNGFGYSPYRHGSLDVPTNGRSRSREAVLEK